MKKFSLLPAALAISVLLGLFACTKNNDTASGTTTITDQPKPKPVTINSADTITYSFSPVDSSLIIRIFYTDTLGNFVSVTDFSKLTVWSVGFPVTVKPFNARVSAEVINRTGKTSNCTVTISLNGTIKEVVPLHVGSQIQSYVAQAVYLLL